MKWIKASERMPGWNVTAKWRMSPKEPIQVTTAKDMMGWASNFLYTLEWLDEQGDAMPADLEQRAKEIEWLVGNYRLSNEAKGLESIWYQIKDEKMNEVPTATFTTSEVLSMSPFNSPSQPGSQE